MTAVRSDGAAATTGVELVAAAAAAVGSLNAGRRLTSA